MDTEYETKLKLFFSLLSPLIFYDRYPHSKSGQRSSSNSLVRTSISAT